METTTQPQDIDLFAMKKRILFTLFIFIQILVFASCKGDKAVSDLIITSGLKPEYLLGEQPDFSDVTATVVFNDSTTITVNADDLIFGNLDTSTPGNKSLEIKYNDYFGFTIYKTVTIVDNNEYGDALSIINVSLPDSFTNFNKSKDTFIDSKCDYIVGDDNDFFFKLSVLAMSPEHGPHIITNYVSQSEIYLFGSSTPLKEELDKYVVIDENRNAFNFTEEAIGNKFTITTRPKNVISGYEANFTRSFDVTVVDGYNVYEAYELNFISNSDEGFDFSETDSYETRTQLEIIDDFLSNEKMAKKPDSLASIVLHKDLEISPSDLPREYFVNRNRSGEFYNGLSIFNYSHTEDSNSFAIYGNCFTIDAHQLPCVQKEGTGPFDGMASSTALFDFDNNISKDKNYDHSEYTTTLQNLILTGGNPKSDTEVNSDKSMRGLIAMRTSEHTINITNSVVKYFYISLLAQDDYQTINITNSRFNSSWQNHIYLGCDNPIQSSDEEPLSIGYPRLTANVKNSIITESGGPAFIIQQYSPDDNCNKYSGAVVNISEDSVVESYVSGNEAWFQAMKLGFVFDLLKGLDDSLQPLNSSVVTEKFVNTNGVQKKLELMNVIAVNLMVPNIDNGMQGIMSDLMGKSDIDGKITIGNKTVLDMDDNKSNGNNSNFGNSTVSALKDGGHSQILSKPDGSVAHTVNNTVVEDQGDISADGQNDYLTVFYYSLGIVFSNYHTTID